MDELRREGVPLAELKAAIAERQAAASAPVSGEDFHEALRKVNKSVSSADLARFSAWMEEFGSS